uniref:Putative secreted protein n=1 Tax=Anopheles darlingi TaxID=43151 RepID=A0A2M4DHP4_ANODA
MGQMLKGKSFSFFLPSFFFAPLASGKPLVVWGSELGEGGGGGQHQHFTYDTRMCGRPIPVSLSFSTHFQFQLRFHSVENSALWFQRYHQRFLSMC